MQKTYKIRMYFINKHNNSIDDTLYTKKMLIDKINFITNSNSKTINDAIENLTEYTAAKGLNKWSIGQTYIEISNDDIIGNIKPDNSFTNTLDLGRFKEIVDSDSHIIRGFSTLTNDQKLTICEFVEKNNRLLEELNIELQFKPEIVKERYIDIVENIVYDLFLSINQNETQFVIQQMKIFNNIEIERLIKFLNEIIENMTVKQLLSKEDEFLNPISNEFWNKIVEENNKEKELKND